MQKKNIFKALAFAMLMPAMLLTTACSSEDDLVNNTAENTVTSKGYALPVTVNVTRQGDATTRATYTYDEGTKKGTLSFSDGDKLFVSGFAEGYDCEFAGELTWQSGETFSGTIYTEEEWTGDADALFTAASGTDGYVNATLLPAGYGSYGFLTIEDYDTEEKYDDVIRNNNEYTLATSKADGVAQFSYEEATSYSSGFALAPQNAILNFTITGLAAIASVDVSLKSYAYTITKTVTTDAFGTATFAAGVSGVEDDREDLNDFTLTVDGNAITLVNSSTELAAGHIYNITRGTGATVDLSTINANYTASNGVTLTGTLGANKQISIADGATVILNNVTINGTNLSSYKWAGITCLGDATIILSGTNTVKGFYDDYPGIQAAVGKTLTINGTGSLTARSNGYGVGIGGGNKIACGNIEIQGGTVTATGGNSGAGIGSGYQGTCGNITISGGTVTATGGYNGAAGIGSGSQAGCGDITITTGVTKVTATRGNGAPNSIGAGNAGTCGKVTIGGVETGNITESPYTYQP